MNDLKRELCNYLIKNNMVKEYDVIRHSYTNSRISGEFKDIKENNICPTLDTRCDCLGVVVKYKEPKTAVNIMKSLGMEKKCVKCGKTKNVDIHHKDRNYKNNNIDNLEYLCRSCHMKEHRKKGICKICGKPQKGYGYCNKHYIRFKKYGDPLYTKYRTKKGDDENE